MMLALLIAALCSFDLPPVVAWEPVTDPDGDAVIYEVWQEGAEKPCLTTTETSFVFEGSRCDRRNDGRPFRVRACDEHGACGKWSNAETWLPCACLERAVCCRTGGCERRCYPRAPLRLREKLGECA